MKPKNFCSICDGKGYTNLRDCVGDIQRSENCSFCGGTGILEEPEKQEEYDSYLNLLYPKKQGKKK